MTTIVLTENAPARSISLSDTAGRALARSGLVDVTPDPERPGHWRVRAAAKVGAARIGTGEEPILLRITPKVPIARLLFLLGYSLSSKHWRDDLVPASDEYDLLPVFARLYVSQVETALRQGLLHGYRETDETAHVMRGRLRHGDQLHRRHGRTPPLEITHDEHTDDITENRLLAAANDVLLRLPGGIPSDVRTRLRRLRLRFANITPLPRGLPLPVWYPSRLNARYHNALRLADLVLRTASLEYRPGDLTVHGFLIDTAKLFEDFVTVALRDALSDQLGHSALQARHHLDEQRSVVLTPDFVHYGPDDAPLAVVDAKYKAERPAGYPNADVYQMLAYCVALKLRDGHLVYAKGNAPHGTHRIRNAGVTIHQHALELDRSPDRLLGEIREIAALLVKPQ